MSLSGLRVKNGKQTIVIIEGSLQEHNQPSDTKWANLKKEHQPVRLTRRQVRGDADREVRHRWHSWDSLKGGNDDKQWTAVTLMWCQGHSWSLLLLSDSTPLSPLFFSTVVVSQCCVFEKMTRGTPTKNPAVFEENIHRDVSRSWHFYICPHPGSHKPFKQKAISAAQSESSRTIIETIFPQSRVRGTGKESPSIFVEL